MFRIDMLPAGRGDCFWIEYGDRARPSRVLIDGGIHRTHKALRARIDRLHERERRFDLLVVTHVDLDHIAGVLELLRDPPAGLRFDDVWFNGWDHLTAAAEGSGVLGAKMGESLSELIRRNNLPWNKAFEGQPVMLPDSGMPSPHKLPGGMHITLLGPTRERLIELLPVWKKEVEKAGLEPGRAGEILEGHPGSHDPREEDGDRGVLGGINVDALGATDFKADTSEANGSSIALIAEYTGRRCLFAGDAFAGDMADSLEALDGVAVQMDAVKLAHHAGRKNTSLEMLARIACETFLLSTDGTIYDHPHAESVARVLTRGPTGAGHGETRLLFNYRSEETAVWDDRKLRSKYAYTPVYPGAGEDGLLVDLEP